MIDPPWSRLAPRILAVCLHCAGCLFGVVVGPPWPTPKAFAQIRVVSYNTLEGPRAGIETVLQAIGEESVRGIAKPIDLDDMLAKLAKWITPASTGGAEASDDLESVESDPFQAEHADEDTKGTITNGRGTARCKIIQVDSVRDAVRLLIGIKLS